MTPRQKAIDLAKKIAKSRDHNTCQRCGKTNGQMHGSHIIPVSARGLIVADPEDIICLCANCHKLAGDSWHEAPLEQEWFHEKFPGRYEKLKKKHIVRPVKKHEWQEVYKKLLPEAVEVN